MKIFKLPMFIHKGVKDYLHNEKGQSLVEFALIIPVVLLILLGILEFGMMLNSYLTISNASREGARQGAIGSSDSDIQAKIMEISPNLDDMDILVEITPTEGSRRRGDMVTISITYNYEVINPLISSIINNSVQLKSQTSMRVE